MARAVEVSGFDTLQQCKDFVKSMKPGGLGWHGGTPALLHVRERSGIMACRGAAGGGGGRGGLIMHDKGYYHSLKKHPRDPHAHRRSTARSKTSGYKNDVKTERREPAQVVRAHRRTALPASGYAGISGERSVPASLTRSAVARVGVALYDDRLQVTSSRTLHFGVDLGETVRAARVVALEPTDRSYLLSARHHRRVGTRDAQDGGADDL